MSGGPLHWFRKNQKIMLVVFGVLLMVVFTVGPMLDNFFGGGGQEQDVRQVATASFGSFTNEQLNEWAVANQNCGDFTRRLGALAGTEQQPDTGQEVSKSKALPISTIPSSPIEMRDRAILNRMALAEFAKENGAFVGDETINEYFDLLCNGELDNQGLTVEEFNRQLQLYDLGGIRNHLKTELLAIYGERLLMAGTSFGGSPTPLEVWQAHKRFNEKVEIEYVSFNVEDFLAEVSDVPSAEEIKKLYEEGSDQTPGNPRRPGFKTPRMATIGYFSKPQKSFAELLKLEKAKISEEAVLTKYNEWKDNNDPKVIDRTRPGTGGDFQPGLGNKDDGPAPSNDPGNDKKGKNDDGKSAPGLSSPENNAPKSDGKQPEKGTAPKQKNPEPAKKDDSKNPAPKKTKAELNQKSPKENQPKKDPPKNDQPGTKEKQSSLLDSTEYQFVSLQEKETAPPANGATQDDTKKKTEPAKTTQPAKQDAPKQADKKGSEPSAPKKQEDPKAKKADTKQSGDDSKKSTDAGKPDSNPPKSVQDDANAAQDQKDEFQPNFKPLDDDLKDLIRTELATAPATEAQAAQLKETTEAFEIVENEVINFLADYDDHLQQPEDFPEPETPDFAALGKEHGLTYGILEETSFEEFKSEELGKAIIKDKENRFTEKPDVARYVFFGVFDNGSPQAIYRANSKKETSEFMYWAYGRRHPQKVSQAEAKDAIVKYYQKQKAVELALAKAKSIAEKVTSQSKLLSAELGDQVTKSKPFQWITPGEQNWQMLQRFMPGIKGPEMGKIEAVEPVEETGSQTEADDVEPLEGVNHEFMAKVFALDENEVGFATDATQEKVYVFQVTKKIEQNDFQKNSLFNNRTFGEVTGFARVNQATPQSDLRIAVMKKYNVKWFGEPVNK